MALNDAKKKDILVALSLETIMYNLSSVIYSYLKDNSCVKDEMNGK